ncbi:MAG: GAF domain-containing protein [Chloroflexi bacterium]|nr:GAF domain-containing protein [Chloroflexota bacterium]MBI5081760.1 GAF domain-containing protein [Chloroflexota bacterium]
MTSPDTQHENAELKAQIALLAKLVEVSVTLSSTLDLKQLLQYIIGAASEILGADAASILLYDDNMRELHFSAATGVAADELAKIPVPLDSSVAGAIFRENRHVIINDVSKDSRHFKTVGEKTKFQSKTLVGVPMRIKDRVTGVIEALNKRNGKPFTEMDARVLAILASQAAVAIENARLIEALQKAYDDLGKLDKMKGDFIAIASHELRTPLGVILGYATFLREETKGELGEYAKAILDSAVHMRKLVEDLTNLRFLEVGQQAMQREKIDLRELLNEVRKELKPLADAKGHTITVEAGDRPLLVNIDRPKILNALSNLLNNAIRFTPDRGSIELISFQKGHEAWVQVKDSGVGIPKRDLDRIFQGFFQVEDHMVRKTGGMGIGLSIVRGTMKLHNGRVWGESEGDGKGSTFTVALPLAGFTSEIAATGGLRPLALR